jgi:uncharacterized protein (DUF1778 family)
MPKSKKLSRKKSADDRKGNVVKVRLTDSQKEALQTAASKSGLELSSWMRMVALKAAESERD